MTIFDWHAVYEDFQPNCFDNFHDVVPRCRDGITYYMTLIVKFIFEAYATQTLVVSSRRLVDTSRRLKADKDFTEADLPALAQTRHDEERADACEEAWDRGDARKEGIVTGLSRLPTAKLKR
ncbi:hypothetical protein ACWF50_11110 [Brucella pseudogrignonensis]|jgi:hypothetical protein